MTQEKQVKILVGTSNPAKFKRYKNILSYIPSLEILSLHDIQVKAPFVEDGLTAEEDARKKARTYAYITRLPTLSLDEALYIGGLSPHEQTGTSVRRYLGQEASDEALLVIFLNKIKSILLNEWTARWLFALCLALPNGQLFFDQVELRGLFTDCPSLPILPGYPLSSNIFDSKIGKTLRDLTPEEEHLRHKPIYEKVNKIIQAAGLSSS